MSYSYMPILQLWSAQLAQRVVDRAASRASKAVLEDFIKPTPTPTCPTKLDEGALVEFGRKRDLDRAVEGIRTMNRYRKIDAAAIKNPVMPVVNTYKGEPLTKEMEDAILKHPTSTAAEINAVMAIVDEIWLRNQREQPTSPTLIELAEQSNKSWDEIL